MEKSILGLIAVVMLATSGFASNDKMVTGKNGKDSIAYVETYSPVTLKLKSGNLEASYEFPTHQELLMNSERMVKLFLSELKKSDPLDCKITITVSASVTVGLPNIASATFTATLSGEVSGKCADVLKKMLTMKYALETAVRQSVEAQAAAFRKKHQE